MASPLKKLLGQTAIYGMSSIIGRLLNYGLTPLYTSVFTADQFGIITEMYAYVAFLVVLLMYGMETAFFRYYSDHKNKDEVFSTALWSLLVTTFGFIGVVTLFAEDIAIKLGYPENSEYVTWFAIIVGLDALIAIPLAKLRAENRPLKFATVNFAFIGTNVALNIFFLYYCLPNYQSGNTNWLIDLVYNPDIGVGYVFILNLISSVLRFVLVLPDIVKVKLRFDPLIWKQLLSYGFPLLIVGLAGMVNETLDKLLLKWLLIPSLGEVEAMTQVGIYGGVYKLSIAITLFVQAYRYAAEPFFFDQKKQEGSRETYAQMLHWFTAFVLFAFLVITLFIDVFKNFLQSEEYWVGLDIVPILLIGNIFLGIYYNLSVWYKLTDKTIYGSYLALTGALITITMNLWLIPILGFRGSAIATLVCYFTMAVLSYVIGQRHFRVPYSLKKLALYFGLSISIYFFSLQLQFENQFAFYIIRVLLVGVYLAVVAYIEIIKPRKHVARNRNH
jgi:O-antigen/teichoic acid export membrane protein